MYSKRKKVPCCLIVFKRGLWKILLVPFVHTLYYKRERLLQIGISCQNCIATSVPMNKLCILYSPLLCQV